MSSVENLAPTGCFGDHGDPLSVAFQTIADARSRRINEKFAACGVRRSRRSLGDFLKRLVSRPDRIRRGSFYGIERPPHLVSDLFDHIRLYTRYGKPFAAILHPYARLNRESLSELIGWVSDVGLNVAIDSDSEYYPGVTLRIVLYREGSEFPVANLC